MSCNVTAGLLQCSPAAANKTGCIGAGLVRSFCGKRFRNGLCIRSLLAPGRKITTSKQRAKGKPGNTVVRALAFKWIRILFRCWKDRTPYCESTYLQGLERRQRFTRKGSPVKLQWKTSAGFRKIEAATS